MTFQMAVLGAVVGLCLVAAGLYKGNDPTLYTGLAIAGAAAGVGAVVRPRA